jgi:hypothetical protein
MKYQNMKVQSPVIEPARPTEEDFMNAWHQRSQYNQMLEVMIQPVLEAIRTYHYPRGSASILLDKFELREATNNTKSVALSIECHINGNIRESTYVIPLSACLGGQADVIAFFVEEKAKQEARADEMGRRRASEEKETRHKLYEELKLEFGQKEDALVKLKDA